MLTAKKSDRVKLSVTLLFEQKTKSNKGKRLIFSFYHVENYTLIIFIQKMVIESKNEEEAGGSGFSFQKFEGGKVHSFVILGVLCWCEFD